MVNKAEKWHLKCPCIFTNKVFQMLLVHDNKSHYSHSLVTPCKPIFEMGWRKLRKWMQCTLSLPCKMHIAIPTFNFHTRFWILLFSSVLCYYVCLLLWAPPPLVLFWNVKSQRHVIQASSSLTSTNMLPTHRMSMSLHFVCPLWLFPCNEADLLLIDFYFC